MITIYKITNTFLNPPKSYIGKTKLDLNKRMEEHLREGRTGGNKLLAQDLILYGRINFTIETVEKVEEKDAAYMEDKYIRELNTHCKDGYGYNMRYEEDYCVPPKIKTWCVEDLEKKSSNLINGEVWNKGLKTKKYISEKIKNTMKIKLENGWNPQLIGRKHSDKTKKKISDIKKQYYLSHRPCNAITWIIEYEDGSIEKTDSLLVRVGGKKQYNRITKWSREHPQEIHPKLKMRVYHDR